MLNPKTCFFFGTGRTKPVYRATDLIRYLPKETRHHYHSGYSMAEAAECWIAAGGRLPRRVAELVGDDSLDAAHFEYGVTVWGQGRSMTDIMAFIPDDLIAEEAKARETFGEEVWYWINQDREKIRALLHIGSGWSTGMLRRSACAEVLCWGYGISSSTDRLPPPLSLGDQGADEPE